MWITKKRVHADLQERFQEDYPQVKRYLTLLPRFLSLAIVIMVCVEIGIFALADQLNLPLFPTGEANLLGLYFWKILSIILLITLLIFSPIIVRAVKINRKYQIYKKLKGSLYWKRSLQNNLLSLVLIILSIPLIFWLLGVGMTAYLNAFPDPPANIPLVEKQFGKQIEAPTSLPFQVLNTYAEVEKPGVMFLNYRGKWVTTVHTGPNFYGMDSSANGIFVHISTHPLHPATGKTVTLQDGTPAQLSASNTNFTDEVEYKLTWQKEGLWYELTRQYSGMWVEAGSPSPSFTEQDILNIANSFQPVESK